MNQPDLTGIDKTIKPTTVRCSPSSNAHKILAKLRMDYRLCHNVDLDKEKYQKIGILQHRNGI